MTPQTRALIEAAEEVLNIWAMPKPIYLKLRAAISSAKAAEEGVEIRWIVEGHYGDGRWITWSTAFDEKDAKRLLEIPDVVYMMRPPNRRAVRLETTRTVISVREKEGL